MKEMGNLNDVGVPSPIGLLLRTVGKVLKLPTTKSEVSISRPAAAFLSCSRQCCSDERLLDR